MFSEQEFYVCTGFFNSHLLIIICPVAEILIVTSPLMSIIPAEKKCTLIEHGLHMLLSWIGLMMIT